MARCYFRAIRVSGRELLPVDGAVLLACTHRNGAVDGLVMEVVLGRPLGIVGRNLTASPYLRFLLAGSIPIHRHPATPADNRENLQQLQEAARAALAGRQLLMFPEGTSKLGPTLLPVKKGMAYLARLATKAAKGRPVRIVPVGLHYSRGFAFRSDVEVVFGDPFAVTPEEAGDLQALTARVAAAMAGVAVSFADREAQRQGELFADLICAANPAASHRAACLAYGSGRVADGLRERFAAAMAGIDRHARVPVLPAGGRLAWELAILLVGAPAVLAALIANLLPCVGAPLVAHRMADDDNVITLWRLLSGLPLWSLQIVLLLLAVMAVRPAMLLPFFAGYGLFTWVGCKLYPRWRLAFAAVRNRFSGQRQQCRAATQVVDEWLRELR